MLDGCHFMNGNEMFNDHVDQFQFPHDRPILFLKFLSLLNHKLLYIIIGFICSFEFVVYLGQLFPSMFHLLLQCKIFLLNLLIVQIFLVQLLFKSTFLLFLFFQLLLSLEDLLFMQSSVLF
jgi:hypothetical protein